MSKTATQNTFVFGTDPLDILLLQVCTLFYMSEYMRQEYHIDVIVKVSQCYPGGREIHFISSTSEVLYTNVTIVFSIPGVILWV